MDTTQSGRYVLDDNRARAWLEHAVRVYRMVEKRRDDMEQLPDFGVSWNPRAGRHEMDHVYLLVQYAQEAGVLTGPGRLELVAEDDSDGGMYRYATEVRPGLELVSPREENRRVGAPDVRGVEAALAVLREARDEANRCLDELDAYVLAAAA